MNQKELEEEVSKCLGDFYNRRLNAIQKLRLNQTLARKNPYLFRAIGTGDAHEIVEHLLRAYLSSSDETIFGDAFFEPIACAASGGTISSAEGVDFEVSTDVTHTAIAVKSGTNWGNAGQRKRLNENFLSLRNRLYKIHKKFDFICGSGYGVLKSEPTSKRIYRDIAGQAFWREITGDPEFYLKLIRAMKDEPHKHKAEFQKGWDATVNKFTSKFISDFCHTDGSINWEKLTKLVSEESSVTRSELNRRRKSNGSA